MTVDSFDPTAAPPDLDNRVVQTLLTAAQQLEAPQFGMDDVTVKRLAAFARDPRWREIAQQRSDDELRALIQLFTLAEERLVGWEGGAKSPVIGIAAELKARKTLSRDLVRWIKDNSNNRFLPHGSLMDRL